VDVTTEDLGGGRVALRLDGRLDLLSAPTLRGLVEDVVAAGNRGVVVDLAGVPFVDSSGVGALVGGLKHARQAGGELRIAAPGEQVRTVLHLTTVDRVLRPYDTVDEAVEGL
jgi:anti-sigma B factor antagonist